MKADLYNLENKVIGSVELPDTVFGVPWKPELVKQVLDAHLANIRRPWAHAKGRGEVRGGGRKPWRQKGTGRARHGSIRSPLWVGGGKAHGPVKERTYSQKVNKKMKRLAFLSALSKKFREGEVKIFESLAVAEPKTKLLASALRPVLGISKREKKFDVLLVGGRKPPFLMRAARNLVKTKAAPPEGVTLYDLLNYRSILIDRGTLESFRPRSKT